MEDRLILPAPYFGPAHFWATLLKQPAVCSVGEHFQKQTFLNRTIIMGPNKIQTLTVPCTLKEKAQTLENTEVVYREKWPLIHVRSLTAAYGKSPYFEHYMPEIAPIILSGETQLGKLNLQTLLKISEFTQIDVQTDNILNPVSHKEYTDFEKAHAFEPYHQVFGERFPFQGNLSILDVLFNLGPDTKAYLARQLV